ncbi:HisA/HisF-related TIM barrel protein [Nocardioides dubius]|uniref:AglZ/HisF2 family acetamidino modification protein n=2 Tax=Nocardioides dubius TaxID=317019 RepID=A0ABN1TY32_9ACTN
MVKTKAFKEQTYVGDAVNAVKIFNEKQADELVLLDIEATSKRRPIDFGFIEDVVSEAFMPVAYGGGVTTSADARRLFEVGVEKVAINSATFASPEVVSAIAEEYGAQAVVASLDVERRRFGAEQVRCPDRRKGPDPVAWAAALAAAGAGELLVTSAADEGSRAGMNLELIRRIRAAVSIPIIAHGGAGTLAHLTEARDAGAAALAAGTMFTFHGPRRAVLIQYPTPEQLDDALGTGIEGWVFEDIEGEGK